MPAIVLDDQLRARLGGLTGPNETLELQDPNGATVGRFVPEELYRKLILCASLNAPYSEAEIARRRAEPGARPLAEFWKERTGE